MTERQTEVLGVVGAGAMGAGIAQVGITSGFTCILHDAFPGAAERGRDGILARLSSSVQKGKMSADDFAAAKERLRIATSLADFAPCDVVVEAVPEDIALKRKIFQELEGVVRETAILASNTSSLPISVIAASCKVPQRVAGLHFFNPVPLMRLVEVVRGRASDENTLATLVDLSKRLGRTPVLVKDTPGFLVNLAGRALNTEALAIVHENVATPSQVDAIMRDCCGFRMGPFELMDLTGIDVNFPVTRFIHESFSVDPRLRTTPLHRALFEAGQLGRKTGKGFHEYVGGEKREPSADAPVGKAPAQSIVLAESDDALATFLSGTGVRVLDRDDGASPILCAPLGEDCTAVAVRTGADHRRLFGLDIFPNVSRRITVMAPPGADMDLRQGVIDLVGKERAVSVISDSPGFVAQRVLAMVVNLGCEIAQMQLAQPRDVDLAVELGLNYPKGPLGLGESFGLKRIGAILHKLQELTGDDRYRPSQWLRRRADLGISIFVEDASASVPR